MSIECSIIGQSIAHTMLYTLTFGSKAIGGSVDWYMKIYLLELEDRSM